MLFRCASVGFDFWLSIHNFFAVLSIKFSMLGAQFAISAFYASLHMRTVEKLFTYNSLKFVIDFPQCWQLMHNLPSRDKTEIYSRIVIFFPTFSLFYFSRSTKYLKYLFLFFNASSTINRKVFVAICCGFQSFPEKEFFKCSTDSARDIVSLLRPNIN